MTFASPLWLWALLALPALAAAEAWATRGDRARTARLVSRALWDRVLRRPAERWRYLRLGLLLAGVAGLVLALARPQWGTIREKVEREGVDVVLVLDTSGSMATEDVAPSRFFLARAALLSLIARLEGDRFGLVAFEGEAYPLVPLTLDADAVGLFLESTEPGIVPGPGSSLGSGLARGLELFANPERRNKAMVLVSDGEDLEGDLEEAVGRAKEAGVVVHTVGVGSEAGQPVPDLDREGNRAGYKKHEDGSPVVSRLHAETLETIARGTGGRYVRLSPADSALGPIASAIEAMDRKGLVGEWSYRKKERYQAPLALGLACLTAGLLLPPPSRRAARLLQSAAALLILSPSPAQADPARVWDEVTLRPRRLTAAGRKAYAEGNHEAALRAFEGAATSRPDDPLARFNVADGLYKAGKLDEAAALFQSLGGDAAPLAGPARYNLGNVLFQKQDYPGAIRAYREALRALPADADTRRNLELALRELKKQQEQQQQQQDPKGQQDQKQAGGQKPQPRQDPSSKGDSPPPQSEDEKERARFQKETGMPKERALQLLSALQQNEKDEQKKLLARKAASRKKTKDW